MASALGGIKVLDLTGLGPSSFAAQMLGDMGAEVIRINAVPGGASRGVGKGVDFIEGMDASTYTDTIRNKKNVGINLKSEAGKRVFQQLAETADVIIESFRPGVMDRLGLGYEAVKGINPRIIFCAVSGYGQDSPYRDLSGHDANYAGMGGALGLVGHSKDAAPVVAQNALADFTTAILQAVIGVLLAVCARERTGRGQLVDISMTDGVIALLNIIPEVGEYLMKGTVPKRGEGLFTGTQPWYAVYQTADDKYLTLCPIEPHFWKNMCRAIGREDLVPRWFTPEKDALFDELRQIFRTKTRDEWFGLLSKADVPVGKVLDIDEVFSDPHVLQRQMVVEVDHPRQGRMRQIGFPIKFSDTPWQIQIPTARLGAHTDEVVTGLGYSQDEINQLRENGDIY
jgi:crotonobetainyl-CoA:carnitine CoA-transferase CaiB-like acyl-CoA transferase